MSGTVGRPRKADTGKNRQAVLDALGKGLSYEQAARDADVALSTVYRYMQDPGFRDDLRELQTRWLQQAGRLLAVRASYAVLELHAIGFDKTVPASIRIRALTAVLTEARAFADGDIHDRLTALEASIDTGLRTA